MASVRLVFSFNGVARTPRHMGVVMGGSGGGGRSDSRWVTKYIIRSKRSLHSIWAGTCLIFSPWCVAPHHVVLAALLFSFPCIFFLHLSTHHPHLPSCPSLTLARFPLASLLKDLHSRSHLFASQPSAFLSATCKLLEKAFNVSRRKLRGSWQ